MHALPSIVNVVRPHGAAQAPHNKKPSRYTPGRFFYTRFLGTGDILGVRAFLALDNLKSDFVPDFQLVKRDAAQIFRMKEEVFLLAFLRDKTKSPIRQRLNCSSHRLISLLFC